MNVKRKETTSWEIRLGITQVVVLVGAITGTMLCAFYLGFFSGRRAGFESALESNVSNFVKLPIGEDAQDNKTTSEEVASQVYAKLNNAPTAKARPRIAEEALPELSTIKNVIDSPVDTTHEEILDSESTDIEPSHKEPAKQHDALSLGAVLGGPPSHDKHEEEGTTTAHQDGAHESPADNHGTLGALARQAEKGEVEADSHTTLSAPKVEKEQPAHDKEPAKLASTLTPPAEKKVSETRTEVAKANTKVTEKAEKPAPAVARKQAIPGGWFAQAGAPRKYEEAERMARKLRASGFAVVIETAEVRGEEYFRILVGPEESRIQAERLVGQLKREANLPGEPFLRLVR
jgi:cell division septation protein DedD